MKNLLKSYLKRLTNLSSGNKSLMQLRLFQGQDLDFKNLEFLIKDLSDFQIIEKLLASTAGFKIAQSLDSRDASNNEASKVLKAINRKNELIFSERGVYDLYVGWPFVQGQMMDGSVVRCPLLFFSVELQESNNHWILKRSANAPISFNRSFLLAYSYYNKVSFTDDFLDTNFEEFSSDSLEFRNELYNFLKESNLEINFNRELFENKISPFLTYKRQEIEELTKLGELKLLPHAVLGIYPQSGSFLVPDYEAMIAQTGEELSIESFFKSKDKSSLPEDKRLQAIDYHQYVKEEQTFTPFPVDASQENALKAIKTGKSIVVQGPPGTGKSQLICNLVADYTARGKKVLIVCQKKVALEVVSQRLGEVGLSDFSVLLHDFKNDRKSIYEQIANQIEKLDWYETQNNQLDSIYLDRNFLKVSREIDKLTEELQGFKKALFDTLECGISIKEMYLNSNPKASMVDLGEQYKAFKINELQEFARLIGHIYPYQSKLGASDYAFKQRVDFSSFDSLDKQRIIEAIESVYKVWNDGLLKLKAHLGQDLSIAQLVGIHQSKDAVLEITKQLQEAKVFEQFRALYDHTPDFDLIDKTQSEIANLFAQGVIQKLELSQTQELYTSITDYQQNHSGFVKTIFYKLFNKEAKKITKLLKDNQLLWDESGIKTLNSLLKNSLSLEQIRKELSTKSFLVNLPITQSKDEYQLWFETIAIAKTQRKSSLECSDLKSIWASKELTVLNKAIKETLALSKEAVTNLVQWQHYLTLDQIQLLVQDQALANTYKDLIQNDFDDLCAFDKLMQSVSAEQQEIITKLFNANKDKSQQEVQAFFINTVYLHWINHIEAKYPILRDVSSLEMNKREQSIREAVSLKGQYSKDIVLQKVRENTYKDIEYNRLNNRVTYRELEHQLTKQRRIWSVRKLMGEYAEEVLKLVPCWLASPEAVSAVFPLDFEFDLVVFDEASQCFAEKGIPALNRAKQFVITGDSQQLSPYDLYQVRFEDEEEEESNSLLEIDSLLDVAKHFLMELSLTGHYRSKSIDLIQFSNEHFYKNALRMLPSKADFLSKSNGFEYHLVDGVWSNNCNEIEVEKVVDLCLDLFQNQSDKTVGVVCFNYKQQQLVYNSLIEKLKEKELLLPKHFFVKNIENVQGDERDIIVFSLAYAPNKTGKLQMNFGSLNQKGGSNRLNVAVTRAKEKNIVVASIMPQQLLVDEAKNDGPRLLKAFLEYAYEISKHSFEPKAPTNQLSQTDWLLKYKIAKEITNSKAPYQFNTSYYFSDLLLSTKENAALVLTDDDLYFETQGVKDAHVYLPQALHNKQWTFTQSYSRNYWSQQKFDLDALVKL